MANKSITQHVIICGSHEKMNHLGTILRQKMGQKVIIFCSTKRMCDQLAWSLGREYNAAALHGDKRQQERDYTLQAFKDGRQPVLVATDVAARGLDVKDVAAVVNYDMPPSIEDYVHRIGECCLWQVLRSAVFVHVRMDVLIVDVFFCRYACVGLCGHGTAVMRCMYTHAFVTVKLYRHVHPGVHGCGVSRSLLDARWCKLVWAAGRVKGGAHERADAPLCPYVLCMCV